MDDMLNVSGHLLSTAEVESALVEHPSVAEAAVVSHPHAVKGECLYCFVTPNVGVAFTPALVAELRKKGSKMAHQYSAKKLKMLFLCSLK
jgi:acetyl-CoA synthetase